ncbi:efflux RND transporter periplasmic adaptor subunit [Dongia soli]|uniref:Efflux RND transporter periplasmic adaptor subunit n=1 Tax=Dongia soli TaxID=600628 RepID=A0ABU5EAG6_9PROT|nr:efflux RND transporter periplasmic adaptor subunit [Dongia soli]MDY0882789.1 efflux RND transporter periplasmic adaptor subunit [Dongia soli]
MQVKEKAGSVSMRSVTGCLALALLLGAAVTLSACEKPNAEAAQEGAAPPPAQVGVVTVQAEKVALTTELPGRTAAYMISEVRPQVGGIVLKRLFEEGSDVKAGQVLYQIDPATYQAAYDNAKAALAKAKANVTSIRLKAQRYKELVGIDAVSKQDYDDATASLAAAEAEIEADKAALETARINLNYTKVTAPISGRIGKSVFTPGALVTAGQAEALARVQQLDPIYVDVTQSTADVLRLRRDLASGRLRSAAANQAKVKLVLEDGSSYDQEGSLQFSDITVDQTTGSITLRAVFPNPHHELLPGMYVRAVLEEGVNDQAILVPQQAVSRDPKGNPIAMVVDANGTAGQRELKTERTVGDKWLVSEGLKPGDQLIVDGLQHIRPGAPVKPVDLSPSSEAAGQQPASQPQ